MLEFSNFVYIMRTTKYISENKTNVLRFIFVFFFCFPFSISQSNVMNMEIFVKDFTGNTKPRLLVQTSGMTICTAYKKTSHILLISRFICPFFFLSNEYFHERNLQQKVLFKLMFIPSAYNFMKLCNAVEGGGGGGGGGGM